MGRLFQVRGNERHCTGLTCCFTRFQNGGFDEIGNALPRQRFEVLLPTQLKSYEMIEWMAECLRGLQADTATRDMHLKHDPDDLLTQRPLNLQHVEGSRFELI